MSLTVGSLFTGIGGFDLGLERAGMRVIWQSEIDPYACAVLRRHWPAIPNLGDVRGITASMADSEGIGQLRASEHEDHPPDSAGGRGHDAGEHRAAWVDVICGGFPCQDISNAGKRAGIGGERSGLWSEFARIVGELRPRYVLVENVAALLGRGIERVLGDLAALGFDAEWHCIPACAVGAPHRRDRVWIVAYRNCHPEPALPINAGAVCQPDDLAHPDQPRPQGHGGEHRLRTLGRELSVGGGGWWGSEPDVGRVAHGVPARVDRLRCLGNAIVPQVAEVIGRAIMAAEGLA